MNKKEFIFEEQITRLSEASRINLHF